MEKRDIAVAIGVGSAKPLPYLSGAVNGARAFHDWASKLGYSSKLVIDDQADVTIKRLSSELTAVLSIDSAPVHRLLIYFAGHGLIREAEEGLWLLSDWHQELRAVAVEGLKRRLSSYYNIEQIAIFADSCRSLPPDIEAADLTPDPVIGRGPYKALVPPPVDKFVATQDGSETFMVPGDTPEEDRCLFSGLLLEGLWGTHPEAFSSLCQDSITSRSLAAFLQSAVPALALKYDRKLIPSVSPTFPEGDDFYLKMNHGLTPPAFAKWPAPEIFKRNMGTSGTGAERKRAIDRSIPGGAPGTGLMERMRKRPRLSTPKTEAGFVVQGGNVRRLWAPENAFAQRNGSLWQIGQHDSPVLQHPVPLLIEFDDATFAVTVALPRFVGDILRDARGISALIYRPVWDRSAGASTENALASMEKGSLRIEELASLTVALRTEKHLDPVLGVISAYLYDSIGDVANIRRMAYYYTQHQQPIPYDIALLGLLPGQWQNGRFYARVPKVLEHRPRTAVEKQHAWTFEGTPEAEGEVAGFWPWLRQGWTFLDDPIDQESTLIIPGLPDLIRHLMPGRFAMLDTEGGRKATQLLHLSEMRGT